MPRSRSSAFKKQKNQRRRRNKSRTRSPIPKTVDRFSGTSFLLSYVPFLHVPLGYHPRILSRHPGGASGKEPTCQCRRCKRCGFNPWVGKIPWRKKWQPTLVFLPGKSHRQRSLEGYSPKSCKESDKLRQLSTRMLITSARPPLPWIFPHLAKESFFPSIFPEIPPYSPHFSWLTGHKVIFPTSTLIKHAAPHDSPSP